MLYNNPVCKANNSQIGVLQQAHFRNELQKKTSNMCLVDPLMTLFQESPALLHSYASEAFNQLIFSGVISQDDWSPKYLQYGVYGFAMSNIFYVYDTETGNLTLQTSSLTLLDTLNKAGKLETKDGKPIEYDVDKWFRQLDVSETAMKKSLKEGTSIRTVKLEPQEGGSYITVIPRSTINFRESIIVPYDAMKQCLLDLISLADTQMIKAVTGDKVRYVTSNQVQLAKLYTTSRVKTLREGIRVGDTYVYLPSLGESVYSPGLTRLDVVSLDSISAGNWADVDTSAVGVNYDIARLFLLSKVTDVETAKKVIYELNGTDISNLGIALCSASDIKEYTRSIINHTFESEVYKVIKRLGYTDEEYKAFKSPVGDCYQEIAIPKTVAQLRSRLDTGVYKMVIARRDGKFSTIIGTNCSRLLTQVYGRNYVGVFESDGVKLSKLSQALLKRTDSMTVAELLKVVSRFRLKTLEAELQSKFPFPDSQVDVEAILQIIETYQQGVEARKTTKPNPDVALVRNCFATIENGKSRDYYKNVDVKSIQAMYKLSKDISSDSRED